ncbi:hypothetical protein KJ975_05235 [Myxococcota bacterium]|nr:hypothetical protein [Myxococcota bacterium]
MSLLKVFPVILLSLIMAAACDDEPRQQTKPVTCGNGVLETDEICDGALLGGFTCTGLGLHDGSLACVADCSGFDTSGCGGACGDGVLQSEFGEICESGLLSGQTCESLGQYGGTLACHNDCRDFDYTDCFGTCGDGIIQSEYEEICDTTALAGQTCESQGDYGGQLACSDDCRHYDRSACYGRCGDTIIQYDFGENCDGYFLGGASCEDLGLFFGERECGADCRMTPGDCKSTLLWGSSQIDWADTITATADGGLLVTGATFASLDGQPYVAQQDVFLSRFSADGARVWTRMAGSSGSDSAWDVAEAPDGSIYLAASIAGSINGQTGLGGEDAALIKYDANGNRLWTRLWGTSSQDSARSIAISTSGIIYVGGTTIGTLPGQASAGNTDVFVTAFDTDGNQLWTSQRGSSGHDTTAALRLLPSGSIVLIGGYITASDIVLRWWSPEGTPGATRIHGTTGNDKPYEAVLAPDGDLWVTGETTGAFPGFTSQGASDIFLLKISSGGDLLNSWQWGSSGSDLGSGLWVDPTGDLWVTGQAGGALEGQPNRGLTDVFLTRVTPAGARVFTRTWGTSESEYVTGLAGNAAGRFISGYTRGALNGQPVIGQTDAFLIFY